MKTARTLTKKILLTLLIGTVIGLSHIDAVMSRDTDIYFSNPNATQQAIKPNVMMIIDTSGSMVSNYVPDGSGGQITRLQAMKNAFNTILDDPSTKGIKMGLMRFSGANAGPVLYPIADLDAAATSVEGNGTVTIEAGLASNSDDAEENNSGAVSLSDTTLNLIDDGSNVAGLRFSNVGVPTGATITGAYIIFDASASDTGTMSLTVTAQKDTTASTFTTTTNNVTSRTSGSNAISPTVTWSPGNWTSGDKVSTADLTPIVQQLVQSSNNWCSGNSMLFTIKGSGGSARQRRAVAMEGVTTGQSAPVLVIQYDPTTLPTSGCVNSNLQVQVSSNSDDAEEYTATTSNAVSGTMVLNDSVLELGSAQVTTGSGSKKVTTTVSQDVGVRFINVGIPQGSTISSAYIDFTVDTTDSSAASFTINGQKAVNAGTFTSSSNNISTRINSTNKTSAAVTWPSVSNPAAGATLTTPDLKTIVQEIVNQSSWSSSSNSMVLVFSGAGVRKVKSYNQNSGLAPKLRVNYWQTVTQTSTSPSTLTVRERLKQIVNGLQAAGNTPIVDSFWEAGLYYRGQSVYYGLKRGDQSGTDAQYTRVSHPATYTGGGGVYRDPGCTDANLSATACQTEEILGSPTYTSPFENGCQNSYIVLLTDGAPTINNSVSLVQGYTGQTCAASIGGTSGNCSNEIASYYFNHNLSSYTDKHNIVTHTIGFGSDVTSATDVQYLQGLATAGGGTFHTAGQASELVTAFQQILSQVNSAPTTFVSPSLSVNAFNKLFDRDEVYFSLFGPQKSVRWPGNVKKFKLCSDATNVSCTFGDVLDANNHAAIGSNSKIIGGSTGATSLWTSSTPTVYPSTGPWPAGTDIPDGPEIQKGGAGQKVPTSTYGTRNVYTYTGSTDDASGAPVDLTGSAHVVKQSSVSTTLDNPALTKTMLGDSAMTDQRYYDIVNWMRGRDIKDEYPLKVNSDGTVTKGGNSSTTDERWKFSDALHSRPLTITYGGTTTNPVIKMFVGTNDGGLRMINTDTASGQEEWIVYIPDFLNKQGLMMDDAQGTHIDGLDGTATAYVIDNNGNGVIEPGSPQNDKVYLFIGERRGGRNLYAFDVTPSSTLSNPTQTGQITPKFLWRIIGGNNTTSQNYSRLGQTWSRPLVTKIRVKGASAGTSVLKTVLVFAGGYDPRLDTPGTNNVFPTGADTMGNAIYIVDPANGKIVWWASGSTSGANLQLSGMDYAIPSDVALLDTNQDGATDRMYVGDSRGQLWRIDLGNQIDPTKADVANTTDGSAGYIFANISTSSSRQANRKFFYPPDVAQVSDTTYSNSPNYDLVVIETGDREDPLDKLTASISTTEDPVHNRLYAFRDYNYAPGKPGTTPAALTESNLYDATTTSISSLTQSDINTYVKPSKGWFMKLKETTSPNWIGEKGLAKAVIFEGKIFFTTFVPTTSTTSSSAGTCAPLSEGSGRLYAVNYLTGDAVYDFTNDGALDRYYTVGGGIPSEIVVIIREGGVSTLVGTSGGAAHPNVNLTMPRYNTYWYQE